MNQIQKQVILLTNRSTPRNQQMYPQQQVQEDLELLIRAHQKIRQLQQQNIHYLAQIQLLQKQFAQQGKNAKNANESLKKQENINEQLVTRIIQLENQLQRFKSKENSKNSWDKLLKSDFVQKDQKFHQKEKELHENHQKCQINNKTQKLRKSQSSPTIQITNNNLETKQQRKLFLSTCKQQFSQQLQKIKNDQHRKMSSLSKKVDNITSKNNYRSFSRNKSQYFGYSCSNNDPSCNISFLKTAKQQFQNQNSKTIKNVNSQNKGYIKTNKIVLKNDQQNDEKTINKNYFYDKTNQFNSRQASVSQLIANFDNKKIKSQHLNPNQLKLNSTSQYNSSKYNARNLNICSNYKLNNEQNYQNQLKIKNIKKKINNNIYFNWQLQKIQKSNKKINNLNRKKQSLQLQLSNENYGMIKYRQFIL